MMKRFLRVIPLLLVSLVLAGGAYAAGQQLYTCGMHPQIIKTEPGNCPICGMKLTPIRANAPSSGGARTIKFYKSTMMPGEVSPKPAKDSMGMDMVPVYEDAAAGSSAGNLQIDQATIQRMNLRTALVDHGPVRREFRTVGTVAYDEQGLRDITTKYEGWLEKVFVNTTWAAVKTGDPLFEIYSPDLYNAQLNYVTALRGDAGNEGPLARAALARLQLFDIPAAAIAELAKTRQPQRTFVYRAPSDGVVIEKMAVAGQMMKPGEKIYRIADLSTVWVQAEIYEKDLPFVRTGEPAVVRTSYGPERSFDGTVDLLVPQVQEQTRTATARIVLPNKDRFLRPGMFVDVRFVATIADDAVLVPDTAVLRSGERNTVFVSLGDGFFEPREVELGARSAGDLYEVKNGLHAGERVVVSGQFMLDSESQLREAIQKMLRPASVSQPAAQPSSQPSADTHAGQPHGGAQMTQAADALQAVAAAFADASAALAADDLGAYRTALPALRSSLAAYVGSDAQGAQGALGSLAAALKDPADLKAARSAFTPLSSEIADRVLAARVDGLHVFECPMAKARWVQRDAAIRNPFYGADMLTCGEELRPAGAAM